MRSLTGLLIFLLVFLLIDAYFFHAVRHVTLPLAPRTRQGVLWGYWGFSALVLGGMLYMFVSIGPSGFKGGSTAIYLFSAIIGLYIAKLVGIFPILVDDLRRLGLFGFRYLSPQDVVGTPISRSAFLSWIGIGAAMLLFSLMAWGRTNLYAYKVRRHTVRIPGLPAAFAGLRIVQLSDIHAGSLGEKAAVQKGIDKVLALQPDVIVFTGDLVNDKAVELEPWVEVFGQLKAPMGVYSVLGNHDYGDYVPWDTPAAKAANMARLQQLQAQMGWRLLLNEHVLLARGDDSIALLGVENWSARGNFVSKGDLAVAHAGTESVPVKLLLSHDPSHWDAQVLTQYPDVALTLSGHTHGMQFGVETGWFRWSPVQWMYKQWAGLYTSQNQHLYVNRGFGFIGYQGRVGILPEITLLTLQPAQAKA